MNKYNFKDGDYVEIYRKPVDGLGTKVSNLPPVGSKGKVIGNTSYGGKFPYVHISFDSGSKNGSFYWAIPCSCLKRVKHIKVKAANNGLSCYDENGNRCMYYKKRCSTLKLFPCCRKEGIIYLGVS